jgi:hypothetical protein
MTRKDYQLIASVIKDEMQKWNDQGRLEETMAIAEIRCSLANAFETDNPRFSRQKFFEATFIG